MSFLLAGIVLGFLGSFHCIGMCGPIALALPVGPARGWRRLLLVLTYNAGRTLTYCGMGVVAGLAGMTMVLAGFQQALSLVMGAILLVSVLLPAGYKSHLVKITGTMGIFTQLKNRLAELFRVEGHSPLFAIGLLNGLLPCGLVYIGLAGAAATGSIVKGAVFMALFGLGTLPAMMAVRMAAAYIGPGVRTTIRRSMPLIIGAMGVLLLLRGLNLGIPYVSPALNEGKPGCHAGLSVPHSNKTILCTGQGSTLKR
jgi:uncharacterized protein